MVYYSPYDGSLYYHDYRGSRLQGPVPPDGWRPTWALTPPRALERPGWTIPSAGQGTAILCVSLSPAGDDGYRRRPVQPEQQQGHFLGSQLPPDGEHDFGAPVENVACVDGVCYALVDGTVWQSADREQWTATSLTVLPEAAPR